MDKRDSSVIELETIQAIYIPIGPEELTYVGTQLPFYNLKTNIFGNEIVKYQVIKSEGNWSSCAGFAFVSDFLSINFNEEDNSNFNHYNLAFEQMKFLKMFWVMITLIKNSLRKD